MHPKSHQCSKRCATMRRCPCPRRVSRAPTRGWQICSWSTWWMKCEVFRRLGKRSQTCKRNLMVFVGSCPHIASGKTICSSWVNLHYFPSQATLLVGWGSTQDICCGLFGEDWICFPFSPFFSHDDRKCHVTICGAGVHGISVALRCQRQGIPYTILERDTDLSGTWHQNIYPGTWVGLIGGHGTWRGRCV